MLRFIMSLQSPDGGVFTCGILPRNPHWKCVLSEFVENTLVSAISFKGRWKDAALRLIHLSTSARAFWVVMLKWANIGEFINKVGAFCWKLFIRRMMVGEISVT